MAILQISKIQQRSGNLVDLPQLDDAEFGWATDTKRLFIGKSTPNENIEVLTSYSQINFSQINGSVGNLNISNINLADGQVLAYDGSEWVNKGGDAGGLLTLGDISNVKIDGGAIGYVLETDGLGNLSWTPKSTLTAFFENVTQADPAVVTTTQDNFFTQGAEITVTNVTGMTQLNGNVFYVDILTSNTFALYHDSGLANTVDSTGYGTFPYATVSATDTLTDQITVANSAPFTVNDPVVFAGNLGNSTIDIGQVYYINATDTVGNTWIKISETEGGNTFDPGTEASPSGARVYVTGGRAVSLVSGGTTSLAAAGTPTQIQYNDTNLLQGSADFTYNNSTKLLNLNGNANVGNLNATGVSTASRFLSNVPTLTPPLEVLSTTRVANLNVSYSNVTDFSVVTNQTTGTFFPVFVSSSVTGNRALASNANISFNAATGNLSVTLLNASSNANVGNLGTAGLITATGNVSGGNLTTAGVVAATGNVSGGNLTTGGELAATGNVSGGNLTTTGALSVTGNANVGNLGTGGLIIATGNITGGNLVTAGIVSATGNVSGGNLTTAGALSVTGNANIGNIGTVAGVFTGNVTAGNVYANSGTIGASLLAGTLTTAAQPNITSVGTLTSLGVNGTVTAVAFTANTGVFTGNGSGLSAIVGANVTGAVSFATTANAVAGANVSGTVSQATTVMGATQNNITTLGALTTLSTGANSTAGSITGNWSLTAGSRLEATYADLAEYYEADVAYEPGTVLMFGGDKEVTLAEDGTSKVAGVVSTNPAYVMNATCPGLLTAVALQGRVPCKVRGKISKGDMLISGGNGFARPNQFPSMGTVIGKALQDFDGYEGVIEVAVGRL